MAGLLAISVEIAGNGCCYRFFFLGQLVTTYRALRRLNPELVHAHWIVPQGLTVALLTRGSKTPFVLTSHGADLFALRTPALRAAKVWICARASAITVVSQAMVSAARDLNVPEDKILVKPMGVDLSELFTPDPRVERDPNRLLFVGRLVEKKGVRYLLEALPSLLELHPHVTLTVAGFGPEEAALRGLTAHLGIADQVSFVGAIAQADLPSLYRRAGIFVAPFITASSGDQEGLGLVLVEALGCHCPVLAGDVPAVRDVLPDSNQRVQPANVTALGAAISELLSHSKKERESFYESDVSTYSRQF